MCSKEDAESFIMYEHPSERSCFRVDIGRAQKKETGESCTFIRVVHLPSGRSRTVVGLSGRSATVIADELATELLRDVE